MTVETEAISLALAAADPHERIRELENEVRWLRGKLNEQADHIARSQLHQATR